MNNIDNDTDYHLNKVKENIMMMMMMIKNSNRINKIYGDNDHANMDKEEIIPKRVSLCFFYNFQSSEK